MINNNIDPNTLELVSGLIALGTGAISIFGSIWLYSIYKAEKSRKSTSTSSLKWFIAAFFFLGVIGFCQILSKSLLKTYLIDILAIFNTSLILKAAIELRYSSEFLKIFGSKQTTPHVFGDYIKMASPFILFLLAASGSVAIVWFNPDSPYFYWDKLPDLIFVGLTSFFLLQSLSRTYEKCGYSSLWRWVFIVCIVVMTFLQAKGFLRPLLDLSLSGSSTTLLLGTHTFLSLANLLFVFIWIVGIGAAHITWFDERIVELETQKEQALDILFNNRYLFDNNHSLKTAHNKLNECLQPTTSGQVPVGTLAPKNNPFSKFFKTINTNYASEFLSIEANYDLCIKKLEECNLKAGIIAVPPDKNRFVIGHSTFDVGPKALTEFQSDDFSLAIVER